MKAPRLSLEVKALGNLPVVEADGDLDLWTSESFVEAMRQVIETGCEGMIVDLRKVKQMDASAIKHLLDACRALGPDRKLCAIARGLPERLIKMARLDSVMAVCSGLENALKTMKNKG